MMDERRWDALARAVASTTPRRRLLQLLGLVPVVGVLRPWRQSDSVAADGSGAIVGGGHHRRHHHHPGSHNQHHHAHHHRKRGCAHTCAGCCDAAGACHLEDPLACGATGQSCTVCGSGETCLGGRCTCGTSGACTGPGELCTGGLCHNPYGCTADGRLPDQPGEPHLHPLPWQSQRGLHPGGRRGLLYPSR